MRITFTAVLALMIVVLIAVGAADADAAGWAKISTDDTTSGWAPSLALSGGSVLAAVARLPAANTTLVEVDGFAPSPVATTLGASVKRTTVVSGWESMSNPVLLGSTAAGGLQVMLAGQMDGNGSNLLNGTSFAARNADGSFATPVPTGLANGATSAATKDAIAGPDGQTPIYIINYGASVRIRVGATGQAGEGGVDLAASQLGGGVETDSPTLGRDASGTYWLSWYNSRNPNVGIYMVQLDPASGNPIGAATAVPDSALATNFGFGHWAMACSTTCRIVYHRGSATDLDKGLLAVWSPGAAAPTAVSGATAGTRTLITAAARPDGRLWVVWFDGDQYRAQLTDANGAGGTPQALGVPTVNAPGGQQLRAITAPDGSLATVLDWATTPSSVAFWANDTPAPGTTYAGPTRKTSATVGDTVLTLVSPKSCVASGSRIVARLVVAASRTKRKASGTGRLKVKVSKVGFLVDGKLRVTDARKPFAQTIVLSGLAPGTTHELRAKVRLKVHHGPPRSRSIRAKFAICG